MKKTFTIVGLMIIGLILITANIYSQSRDRFSEEEIRNEFKRKI